MHAQDKPLVTVPDSPARRLTQILAQLPDSEKALVWEHVALNLAARLNAGSNNRTAHGTDYQGS